jgi:hypothetical protein
MPLGYLSLRTEEEQMKSVMGFLMLLFSATMALADDYQIIPGGVRPSGTVQWSFYALVVDVTSGPMYICAGTLDETNLATTSVKCQKMQLHNGVSILPGPVALSPISSDSGFRYPGIWQALGGTVTFCTNKSLADPQYWCATTKLQ